MSCKSMQSKSIRSLPVILVVLLASCATNRPGASPAPESPEYVAQASGSVYYFSSLEDLAATSDAVVMGIVRSAEKGEITGIEESGEPSESEGEVPMRLRAVEIEIAQVFKSDGDLGTSITIQESGYDRKGQPFEMEGYPWSIIGDTGIFFLQRNRYSPTVNYQLFDAVGRVLFDSERVISFSDTPLGVSLMSMDREAVIGSALRAVSLAQEFEMAPQKPFEVRDRPWQKRESVEPREQKTERPKTTGPPTPERYTP